MLAEGRSGEARASSGVVKELRTSGLGEIIVNDIGHGRFVEAALRGRLYHAGTTAAFAAAAANVSPLAAGTGQPIVGLYNPANSGAALAILKASLLVAPVASTAVALVLWNIIPSTIITAAATAVGLSGLLGGPSPVGRFYSNTALTGSVLATALRYFQPEAAAIPAAPAATTETIFTEDTDGAIVIPPGAFAGLALSAAGTTFNVTGTLMWAEVPFPY